MADDRRDLRIERLLDRLQIGFKFDPDFAMSEIIAPERGTQVRSAAHRSQVDEYAVAMMNGALFPPLVVHRDTKKLIDGNTRKAAAEKAGVESFPVYLADARTPRLAMILQGSLNQLNGERLSNEQAYEVARLMHDQGYDADAIAVMTGRRAATVLETLRIIDFEKRAEALQVDVAGLSKPVKAELAQVQLDEPLRLVAAAAKKHGKSLKKEDVREVRTELNAAHSEAEALKKAQAQTATWEAAVVPPTNDLPKEKGTAVRKAAEALLDRILKVKWDRLSDSDYIETVAKLGSVCDAVGKIPTR